jgi:hypothetical protein
MDSQLLSFYIVLGAVWFLLYWVLGGVFFAVIAIMRLGRIRTVRFSCLFSFLSLVAGVGASYMGLSKSQGAIESCVASATKKAEIIVGIFGCGLANILTWFLLGASVLVLGGFAIMAISKSKSKPWIVLDEQEEELPENTQDVISEEARAGKFF